MTHRVTEPLPKAGHRRDECACGATKDARSRRCHRCASAPPQFTSLDAAYAFVSAELARYEAALWDRVYHALRRD